MGIVNKDLAQIIIDRIYDGDSLHNLLIEHKITSAQWYKYLYQYPETEIAYARAREASSDKLVDEAKEIADNDTDAQRARNRIQIRQWIASKRMPGVYGDRIDLNVNQVVDISSALMEARGRVLPRRDPILLIDTQTIKSTQTNSSESSDKESDAPLETGLNQDAPPNSSEDIFD